MCLHFAYSVPLNLAFHLLEQLIQPFNLKYNYQEAVMPWAMLQANHTGFPHLYTCAW